VEFREPVAVWRRQAAEVRAIVSLVANLQRGEPGRAEDWSAVAMPGGSKLPFADVELPDYSKQARLAELSRLPTLPKPDRVDRERRLLADVVNGWIEATAIHPRVTWTAAGTAMALLASGAPPYCHLASILAVQLLAAVTSPNPLVQCAECGQPYESQRQPRQGERAYCPTCNPPHIDGPREGKPSGRAPKRVYARTRRPALRAFWRAAEALGLSHEEVYAMLEVKTLRKYPGGPGQALADLRRKLSAGEDHHGETP
jgi:hypothetical protein